MSHEQYTHLPEDSGSSNWTENQALLTSDDHSRLRTFSRLASNIRIGGLHPPRPSADADRAGLIRAPRTPSSEKVSSCRSQVDPCIAVTAWATVFPEDLFGGGAIMHPTPWARITLVLTGIHVLVCSSPLRSSHVRVTIYMVAILTSKPCSSLLFDIGLGTITFRSTTQHVYDRRCTHGPTGPRGLCGELRKPTANW